MTPPVWRPTPADDLPCGRQHAGSGGGLDESARRLSHAEFEVAEQLASEGHQVRALADRPGRGRTADLLVCATPVEVKSWLTREQRDGIPPGVRSVANKLLQAEGQATTVALNGRGSGLTSSAAQGGLARYAGLPHRGNVAAVRVLGDGFDLAWRTVAVVDVHRRLNGHERADRIATPRHPDAGLGR